MSHPDKYAVGLLGLGMAALALLMGLGIAVFVCCNTHRFLPLRRSRTTYWIGMALMVPPWLATFPLAPKAMQALAVIASFGWDAYADGLRVISKHGQLSDGRFLGVFWAAAMGVGCVVLDFSWVIPVTAWHCHFNPSRKLQGGVAPTGVVRLDGEPLRPGPRDQNPRKPTQGCC